MPTTLAQGCADARRDIDFVDAGLSCRTQGFASRAGLTATLLRGSRDVLTEPPCARSATPHAKHDPASTKLITPHFVFFSVFDWRHSRIAAEDIPECFDIRIANFVHHFIDRFLSAFELFFGSFGLHALHVFYHGIGGCFFKSTLKTPSPYTQHITELPHFYLI